MGKKLIKKINILIFSIIAFCMILSGCGNQTSASVEVDGILISKKNLYLAEGQTAVISAQVYPFNANNQNYTFESSNPEVVNIDDGFVVAKKAGDAIIYVFSDEGGYKDSCNVLVTTARDNLEINDYNNLNMPARELEPIYNTDDYVENSKSQSPKVSQKSSVNTNLKNTSTDNSKNTLNKNNYKTKNINRRTQNNSSSKTNNKSNINNNFTTKPISKNNKIYNQENNKKFIKNNEKTIKNSKKTSNLLDFTKDIVKNVSAEVSEDIDTGKQVFEDLKSNIIISIENISSQKEIFNEFVSNTSNSLFQAFNNLQNEMLDYMQNIQKDMLKSIEEAEEKVEAGEWTVESQNMNGVSFVVIKGNNTEQ